MEQGWISIHRKIKEHWLWEDKPFSRGQAWIDLLLSANYSQAKFLMGGELISADRGDVITSEVKLSERWGWSRKKVRNFLKMLEVDGMIVQKKDNRKTVLNILNYELYQLLITKKEQPKEQQREQQKNTLKCSKTEGLEEKTEYKGTAKEQQTVQQKNSKRTSEEHQRNIRGTQSIINNNENNKRIRKAQPASSWDELSDEEKKQMCRELSE